LRFMYIREVTQTAKDTGKKYSTYRLVESVRTSRGVRQRLLLNLGSNFSLAKDKWNLLANRIEEITTGQQDLFESEPELEKIARRYAKALTLKQGKSLPQSAAVPTNITDSTPTIKAEYHSVDINSVANSDLSSIGGEHVAHQTILQLGLDQQLKALGFNSVEIAGMIGTIVGRMLHPDSERETHRWLQENSGLGELIDYDFNRLSLDKLYRVSDALLSKKTSLEQFLYEKEKTLFNLDDVVTLYDLTNTYFEGGGQYNTKAAFGRSKEKRSDCPLVTLALVLNRDGFTKCSEVLSGNVSEPKTFKGILQKLDICDKAIKPTIIMDAGIATEENVKYLRDEGYTYIVVSRKRNPVMPEGGEETIVKAQGDNIVTVTLIKNAQTDERELYCSSTGKAKKEKSMRSAFCQRYEAGLTELAQGLHKKGCVKKYDKILIALGRLKEKYKHVSGKYEVELKRGDAKKSDVAIALTWSQKEGEQSTLGIYCLRTNNTSWNEQEIWKTYMMLTEIESAFRCMKSELGMRPVHHQITRRVDGHLFITILAYHIIHSIRYQLKGRNIDFSWKAIREILSEQYRITTTMTEDSGKTINIRQTSQPTQWQRKIYSALGIAYLPGKRRLAIV
jgi:transposase